MSIRKWEVVGVGCAGGGGVLAAIEFEQPDQGTGMQCRPRCSRTESMAILRVAVVLACAEVEQHTQAHKEAKGTLHNTPHTHTKQTHTLLNAKCGNAFANDHTTANAPVLVRSPKLSAVGLR